MSIISYAQNELGMQFHTVSKFEPEIMKQQQNQSMQNTTSFHLPKLRPNAEPNITTTIVKAKAQSYYTNHDHPISKPNLVEANSYATIKDSRSKSTAHGLSHINFNPHLKTKYSPRSIEYFKKKERSMNSLDNGYHIDSLPIEKYVEGRMKDFDKQALIDLAKSGMNLNVKKDELELKHHRVIPKKKKASFKTNEHEYSKYSQNSLYSACNAENQRIYTSNEQKEFQTIQHKKNEKEKHEKKKKVGEEQKPRKDMGNDTKYGSFKPPSIAPVRHSIIKIYQGQPIGGLYLKKQKNNKQ